MNRFITGLRSLLAGYADIAFVTHSRNELIHALSGKRDDKKLVLIVDVSFDCENNNDATHYISRIQGSTGNQADCACK
jgi:two-component system capsular synthesis response regulator RcsB